MAGMLPDGRRLGAHLAIDGGLAAAAVRAAEIGATALQIFGGDPTSWPREPLVADEIAEFQAVLAGAGVTSLAIHASYLINLAGADPAYRDRSIAMLAAELRVAALLGAGLVNVHTGSHGGDGIEPGIQRLVSAIGDVLAAEGDAAPGSRPTIVLENSVGGGFGLGTNLAELGSIADALDRAGVTRGRVGFCLDTAHAWGAGIDLADARVVDGLIDGFDARIGIDRLRLVHLNDTTSERGSRTDRHQHLGAGRIGEAGLGHILRHPALAATTFILETPGMDEGFDAINLARAVAMARGMPLVPLPAAALSLPRRRSRHSTPDRTARPPEPSRSASEPTT